MGKILAIFAVLLGTINGLAALSCLECGTYTCTPLPRCRGDVTKGVCNCCDVCAKIAGEGCGGPWGIAGTCSRGLTCVKDPNDPLEDFQSSGTCECPAHSSWNQCGSACPTTCDNLGTNVLCPEVCVPSCTCDDGYVLKDGNCILEDQCGGTECPEHSSWDPCGLACPTTCDNLGTNILCPRICIAGCACDDGYVLNNGSCIPENQCGGTGPTRRPPCRPHSEWNECGSACPATCADPNPEQPCLAVCAPRCVCVEGYVMDNGNCIPVDRCGSDGCDYEGNQYNDGDEWAVRESPGLGCQCEGTEVVCYVVDCAPGYQHVIGRDGLWTCERKNECPQGYLRPRRSVRRCYKLVTTGTSYQNAEQQCLQDGARLVTLKAKQINKWLKNEARREGSDMWIGLSYRVTEKKLVWSDGDQYNTSKLKRNNFWAKGAFRQYTADKDCVYMSRRDGYRWRFGNCADERLFTCEFVLG